MPELDYPNARLQWYCNYSKNSYARASIWLGCDFPRKPPCLVALIYRAGWTTRGVAVSRKLISHNSMASSVAGCPLTASNCRLTATGSFACSKHSRRVRTRELQISRKEQKLQRMQHMGGNGESHSGNVNVITWSCQPRKLRQKPP